MKTLMLVAVFASIPLVLSGRIKAQQSFVPTEGFVPDSITAVRVAVAIWTPIYGAKQIASERPYRAELRGEVWTVSGYLSPGSFGGVAEATISRRDAHILSVSHGR